MAEKIRPMRAAREALFADLQVTQHEFQEAMEGRSGKSLVEIAEIEARFGGKIGAYAQIGASASGQEISLWTEYVNSDVSNPFKAQQAGLEVKQILEAEGRLAATVEEVAGQYGRLAQAQEKDTGLEIDQQNADANMLGSRASMVSASASAERNRYLDRDYDLEERRHALEERKVALLESGEGMGDPPRPADRTKLMKAINDELALYSQMPGIENMSTLAAEVATEGLEFDPNEAMKDAHVRTRLISAARDMRLRDQGADMGDKMIPRRAQERLDAMYKEQEERRAAYVERKPMKEAATALRSAGGDYERLSDKELDSAIESTRGALAGVRRTPGVKSTRMIQGQRMPVTTRRDPKAKGDRERFGKLKELLERLESEKQRRSRRGLSAEAEASVDELLGAGE